MAAQVGIDHRLCRVVPHATGAENMGRIEKVDGAVFLEDIPGAGGVQDSKLVAMHGNDSSSSSAGGNDTAQYPPLSGYVINAAPSTVVELCIGSLVCMAFAIVAQAHWSLV